MDDLGIHGHLGLDKVLAYSRWTPLEEFAATTCKGVVFFGNKQYKNLFRTKVLKIGSGAIASFEKNTPKKQKAAEKIPTTPNNSSPSKPFTTADNTGRGFNRGRESGRGG